MPVFDGNNLNNTIVGSSGDDTLNGYNGNDSLSGLAGNGLIVGGAGNDTLLGGTGNDTLIGDAGRDLVYGGDGDDVWLAGDSLDGSDSVYMEAGDDLAQLGFFTSGQYEFVDGGTGNDTLTFDGNAVNNIALNGTIAENGTVTGNFTSTALNFENLTGGAANNALTGNSGANILDGKGGNDTLNGGGGGDTLLGGDGNDVINGGTGNDVIDAGNGYDLVDGGTGNDTITGGGDNDNLNGGNDADLIIVNTLGTAGVNNTTVNGGSGGNDNDTLDISALLAQGYVVTNHVQNPETNGNPGFNGQIQLFNATTGQSANINYTDIENVIIVPCFTDGAMIATPKGEVPVQALREGDRVFTRDNGIQEIRWVGAKALGSVELMRDAALQPVLIRKGALGKGMPERDLLVSPNHRVLVTSNMAEVLFDEREVLVAAKHLTGMDGIDRVQSAGLTYRHLMFDHHEVLLSDGAWTESFQPGDHSLKGVGGAQRDEILSLFPGLADKPGLNAYSAARKSLKGHEARLLMTGAFA